MKGKTQYSNLILFSLQKDTCVVLSSGRIYNRSQRSKGKSIRIRDSDYLELMRAVLAGRESIRLLLLGNCDIELSLVYHASNTCSPWDRRFVHQHR